MNRRLALLLLLVWGLLFGGPEERAAALATRAGSPGPPIRVGATGATGAASQSGRKGPSKKGGSKKPKKGSKKGSKKKAPKKKSKKITLPKPRKPGTPRPPLYPQEPGSEGWAFPEAVDARTSVHVLHDDTAGGAPHAVLGLVSRPGGGVGVVWTDESSGGRRWLLREVELEDVLAQGVPTDQAAEATSEIAVGEPSPRPLDETDADRLSLAYTPEGAPLVAWDRSGRLRFQDERGRRKTLSPRAAESDSPAAKALSPAGLVLTSFPDAGPAGDALAAWSAGSRVLYQRLRADGTSFADPEAVAAQGLEGVLHAIGGPQGVALILWNAGGQVRGIESRVPGRRRIVAAGPGVLLAAAAARERAGAHGGAWLVVQVDSELRLRRIELGGEEASIDVAVGSLSEVSAAEIARVELALTAEGPAVLVEPASGGADSLLWLFDDEGRPASKKPRHIHSGGRPARSPSTSRMTYADGRLWFAWSTSAGELFLRTADPRAGGRFEGAPLRLDAPRADAHQRQPRVAASVAGAVAVWVDERGGAPWVVARPIAPARFGIVAERADEVFETRELLLPARAPLAPGSPQDALDRAVSVRSRGEILAAEPNVAVSDTGSFLVVWSEPSAAGAALRGQAFSAAGEALAVDFELEDGTQGSPVAGAGPIGLCALRGGRGFAGAWVRTGTSGEPQVVAAHLGASGVLRQPALLAAGPVLPELPAGQPACCVLDDNRVIVVWEGTSGLVGRFLAADLRVDGRPFAIDSAPGSRDARPAVAAGPQGAFVVAWQTGAGAKRDVYARFYDGRGLPTAPQLALSTDLGAQSEPTLVRLADRGWAVAWKDDLSGADRVVLRRIHPDRSRLGAAVNVGGSTNGDEDGPLAAAAVGAPAIAPYGNGLLALWSAAPRERGLDVLASILGPNFDDARTLGAGSPGPPSSSPADAAGETPGEAPGKSTGEAATGPAAARRTPPR